jgi:hypothetical protein
MSNVKLGEFSIDRMVQAIERVRARLLRATSALEEFSVPYAVTGGNAVAAWVSTVDEAAIRNTPDVDLIVRRDDFERAARVLVFAGFLRQHNDGNDVFLEGPYWKARDAVHIIFAGEKVRPEHAYPAADVDESRPSELFRVVTLAALVRMKLTSFRDKDKTHLRDLLDVGLIDASWLDRLPADLAARLKELIDNPNG